MWRVGDRGNGAEEGRAGDWPGRMRSLAHLRKGKRARVRSGQGGDLGSNLLEPQRWNRGLRSGLWRIRLSWGKGWAASVGRGEHEASQAPAMDSVDPTRALSWDVLVELSYLWSMRPGLYVCPSFHWPAMLWGRDLVQSGSLQAKVVC